MTLVNENVNFMLSVKLNENETRTTMNDSPSGFDDGILVTQSLQYNSSSNLTVENATKPIFLQNEESEYIYDRVDVRVIFISLYTLVFCCCFFGEYIIAINI